MAGKSGISKTLVWILLGLLILGLGGFGATNLTGTVHSVASVGETDITVNEYARALQNEINALESERGERVRFTQAQQEGVDAAALSQLLATSSLVEETRRLGISIGDGNLGERIRVIPAFQGLDGNFDREAYSFALDQVGMREGEFEENFRGTEASSLLQAAVLAGVNTSETYTNTLLRYLAEERDITWAALGEDDLETPPATPTEAQLEAYHAANPAEFTTPEVKRITYAWLTPEMIIDTVEVDEAELRTAYDERIDEFNMPERRLVERLAFANQDAASTALAQIESGETTFEALVEARGLNLADVDLGDVRPGDLGDAGAPVFAATAGDIVGPVDTSIGPALFRVNAVLQAQETSFEDAIPALRDEVAADRARRVIDAQVENVDDLLAGGATIEDLGKETEMQVGQIDWHATMTDDIAAYIAFRVAAAALTPEDFPDVMQLEDNGIFAMRLDEIVPPRVEPLDQVREAAAEGWRRQAVEEALNAQVQAQAEELKSGASFEELGMTSRSAAGLNRRGIQDDVPAEFAEILFGMSKGDVELIQGGGRLFVLRLDDVRAPNPTDEDLATLRQSIEDQTANSMSQDLYQALAEDIRSRIGVEINQQALNAVHANFQ